MKPITRRTMLKASLGASQLALLGRLGLGDLRAEIPENGPTRLLTLFMPGGVRFYEQFVPIPDANIALQFQKRQMYGAEPVYFSADDLITLPGDSGNFQPLRMSKTWKDNDPGDRSDHHFSPIGYSWLDLASTTAVVHGVGYGTVAHPAGIISATCGIPGSTYAAPSVGSNVANYLYSKFQDSRPIPYVMANSQGGRSNPKVGSLPASYGPLSLTNTNILKQGFSDKTPRWKDCDARIETEFTDLIKGDKNFLPTTNVDAYLLKRFERFAKKARQPERSLLAQLYDGTASVSKTLAADLVAAVEKAVPVENPLPDHLRNYGAFSSRTGGYAQFGVQMENDINWLLKILKSNITSVVYAGFKDHNYDSHQAASLPMAYNFLRAQMEVFAQLMSEMKKTPSPDMPGRSLYDDTIIVIYSDFARTWGLPGTDDHNHQGAFVISGGAIKGNRQIGNYELPADKMFVGSAPSVPMAIQDEGLGRSMRPALTKDMITTIYDLFGMKYGKDYFMPGTHGVIQGLRA